MSKLSFIILQGHNWILQKLGRTKNENRVKVFGIGNNKTGTTSLQQAMKNLGYICGDQRAAELLHIEWGNRDFAPVVEYCKTAEFFQDFPFSKPFTFAAMDQAFPNSKFILTVRDSSEQWFSSLTQFHAKMWGKNGRIPTNEDLKNATYIYKGRPFEMRELAAVTPADEPYHKDSLINAYNNHNNTVINYFIHRPNDLLILNVSEKYAYKKLCEFLKLPITSEDFPWENKT
jgi:hypothetical protein